MAETVALLVGQEIAAFGERGTEALNYQRDNPSWNSGDDQGGDSRGECGYTGP